MFMAIIVCEVSYNVYFKWKLEISGRDFKIKINFEGGPNKRNR